jgi:hypothetical protein
VAELNADFIETAIGLSDEDVLKALRELTRAELLIQHHSLLQRRTQLRKLAGHPTSPFVDMANPVTREYESLVRLTDLVKVALSREPANSEVNVDPAILGNAPSGKTGEGTSDISSRKLAVQTYIDEILNKTGRRITKKDIWSAAGYKSRAEFERWESGWYEKRGKNTNQSADKNIRRVLAEKPHLK